MPGRPRWLQSWALTTHPSLNTVFPGGDGPHPIPASSGPARPPGGPVRSAWDERTQGGHKVPSSTVPSPGGWPLSLQPHSHPGTHFPKPFGNSCPREAALTQNCPLPHAGSGQTPEDGVPERSEKRGCSLPPLRAGAGAWNEATGDERSKRRLHTQTARPWSPLGTGRHRFLTFLILLLLLLSTGSEQGKDDACLGVHTNGSHHHSSRTFHDMSTWQHRGTRTGICTAGRRRTKHLQFSRTNPRSRDSCLQAPGGSADPGSEGAWRPTREQLPAQEHKAGSSQVPPGVSGLSVLFPTAFAAGISTGLSQNLLERERYPPWFFLSVWVGAAHRRMLTQPIPHL